MGDTVKLSIISGFNPAGIQAARKGIADLSAESKKASGALASGGLDGAQFIALTNNAKAGIKATSQLASALGSANGGLGAAARGASGAIGAFAAGGPAGLAIAVIAALTLGTVELIQKMREAKEKADAMARALREAFRAGLEQAKIRQVNKLKSEYAALGKEIDAAASRADKLASARSSLNKSGNAVDAANAADTLKNIEAGYLTRMSAAVTQEERAVARAEYGLEIARAKNAESIRAAQAEVAAAETSMRTEAEKTDFAKERLAAAREQLALAEKSASQLPAAGMDKARAAANDAVSAAKADVAKAKTDFEAGEIAVKASAFGLEAANTALKTVRTEAAMRENAALDAQDEITKAIEKRKVVAERLIVQEERLAQAVLNEAIARERGLSKENARNAAVAGGAAGLHAGREAVREGKKGIEEANAKEARWAANQEKKLESGTKLSPKNLQRLLDFRDFKQLQGRGDQKEFNVAANEAKKVQSLKDNLNELKKLNANIDKVITVN